MGLSPVCGELKKLGVFIGDTTVRKILVDEGLQPPSQTYSKYPVQWQTFLAAHYESLVACDFFTKRIYTLRGTFTAYSLVFIHIESRRVYCSPATLHPNATWVMQQCRNASMWLEDEGLDAAILIHDRDRKYPDFFKEF